MKKQIKIVCGVLALFMAAHVSAATTWGFSNSGTVTANSFTTTASSVSATATAWANTGPLTSPNNTNEGSIAQQTSGYLYRYGSNGLGINNFDGCSNGTSCDLGDLQSSQPEHAIDNDQRYEMILLSFSSSVQLTSASFGWVGSDADFTVLAYNGSTPVLPSSWADVGATNSGWTKIGDYSNGTTSVGATTGSKTINSQNVFSSYWLVGAYNPLGGSLNSAYAGADYMKLSSVTGNLCTYAGNASTNPNCSSGKIPEPGSLVLFSIALIGVFGFRKQQKV